MDFSPRPSPALGQRAQPPHLQRSVLGVQGLHHLAVLAHQQQASGKGSQPYQQSPNTKYQAIKLRQHLQKPQHRTTTKPSKQRSGLSTEPHQEPREPQNLPKPKQRTPNPNNKPPNPTNIPKSMSVANLPSAPTSTRGPGL